MERDICGFLLSDIIFGSVEFYRIFCEIFAWMCSYYHCFESRSLYCAYSRVIVLFSIMFSIMWHSYSCDAKRQAR